MPNEDDLLTEEARMEHLTELDAIRENVVKLAIHHKKHCEGSACDISLFLLRRTAELAGIRFSAAEKAAFM